MERSQSYTSFETSGSGNGSGCINRNINNNISSNHFNLSRTNLSNNKSYNNSNNSSFHYNYNKSKYASTSSLNLRKALEMRQTQLQMQQQQQQEQLQRQQWLLLYEQRRKQQQQQQLLKQQQFQQLQHAQSTDNINAPLFLSSLNGLQLLQKRRQKMLQRQKSTTSMTDELDFPLNPHQQQSANNAAHEDDDDEDFDIELDVALSGFHQLHHHKQQQCLCADAHHQLVNDDDDDQQLTITANSQPINAPLQQKLLQYQRQRPHSEAALSYCRAHSPLPIDKLNQSQSAASSPTSTTVGSLATKSCAGERRRLQQFDQSLSFDSAISSATQTDSGTTAATSRTNDVSRDDTSGSGGDSMSPLSPRHPHFGKLKRDNSLHSDSSRYSSVDSLLESRKPDPEAILINLGFGPVVSEDILSRIPKRFLKPSQLRGIDTDAFVRRLQLANNLADHSVLGYRGLIGNPDLPPSSIVAKIMQRFEVNERKKSMGSIEQTLR